MDASEHAKPRGTAGRDGRIADNAEAIHPPNMVDANPYYDSGSDGSGTDSLDGRPIKGPTYFHFSVFCHFMTVGRIIPRVTDLCRLEGY